MGGQQTAVAPGATVAGASTGSPSQSFVNADGSINYGALISGLGTAVGGALGSSSAAGAQVTGINNAIGTQQGVQTTNTGLINSGINTQLNNQSTNTALFQPQIAAGNSAFGNLTNALTPGSGFSIQNIPGLTQAVGTAETAQNNNYASFGALGNSGTSAQIGNYIAGNVALPAYNNYVQSLIQAGQLGSTGSQAVANSNIQTGTNISQLDQSNINSNLQTGANISQLQQNAGVANSSGVAGTTSALLPLANTIGNSAGSLIKSLTGTGANASGVTTGNPGLGLTSSGIVGGASPGLSNTSNPFDGSGAGLQTPSNYLTGNTSADLSNAAADNNANLTSLTDSGGGGYDFSSGF
jgi:hypothetical protein